MPMKVLFPGVRNESSRPAGRCMYPQVIKVRFMFIVHRYKELTAATRVKRPNCSFGEGKHKKEVTRHICTHACLAAAQ